MYLKLIFCLLLFSCSGLDAGVDKSLAQLEKMKSEDFFESKLQRKLAEAISVGDVAKLKALVGQGAELNYLGAEGMTPLMWGIAKQNYDSVSGLLGLGADPNLRTDAGSAVELAAILEDTRYLRALLEHGGDVDTAIGKSGRTVLFETVLHERMDNLQLLVERGANVNHQSKSGESLLIYAISSDSYKAALELLKLGADPTIEDRWGYDAYEIFDKYAGKGLEKGSATYGYYEAFQRELEKLKQKKSSHKLH